MNSYLKIAPHIQKALDEGGPVVALESTLITHGFSYPDNVHVAQAMEAAIREEGAIPATIAVLGGELTVGLSGEQIENLGTTTRVRKCSRRDLPLVIAQKMNGSTTVASTMLIAHWAGIRLFATGGIGGVHRGHPFDVSADILELGRTPIAVVCAGAKAILDLPLTLEALETQGIPVVAYQTDYLPAFYSRTSGLPVDLRIDTPQEAAQIITAREGLGLDMGILFTNPVPIEDEWPAAEAQAVIEQAMRDAEAEGITGKDVTPFLLDRVNTLSSGVSKAANIALLLNNARLASQIALALSEPGQTHPKLNPHNAATSLHK